MKITETIERDCCEFKDLKPYKGYVLSEENGKPRKLMFCQYCGQLWQYVRKMDAAGSMDSDLEKVPL